MQLVSKIQIFIYRKIPSIDFSKETPRPSFITKNEYDFTINSAPLTPQKILIKKNENTSNSKDKDNSFIIKNKKKSLTSAASVLNTISNNHNISIIPKIDRSKSQIIILEKIPKHHIKEDKKIKDANKQIDENVNECLQNMKYKCNGPCLGMYEPIYSSIMKNSPNIKFNHDASKKKNKKYLIQKLCKSYIISPEYKVVKIQFYYSIIFIWNTSTSSGSKCLLPSVISYLFVFSSP